MGARPSTFKKGGGFLNGVDSTIVGYQWTDEFNGEPFKPSKIKDLKGKSIDKPHNLNFFLSVRVDGAEEDTTVTIKAAPRFDEFEVSDDGLTLTRAEGGECSLSGNSATGKFLASLCTAGFDESQLDEDPDSINLEPIIGLRIRTEQQNKSKEELDNIVKLGAPLKRKGKNGKEYNRQDLVVTAVYGQEEQEAAPAKSAKPGKVVAKGKAAKEAVAEDEPDELKDLSKAALLEILKTAGGHIVKSKLSMKTLTTPTLKGDPRRDDAREWLFNDDNLAELVADGSITYKKSTGEITATA